MKNKEKIISEFSDYVMPTYTRFNLVVAKGRASKIWDVTGKEYIDFFPGWAVSGIGHCHPKLVKTLKKQLEDIIHVPNNYYNLFQGKLARRLSKLSFPGKVFFANSGAESVEASIKLARLYGKNKGRFKILTMKNSFHGRTFGALSATGQEKYHKGFEPLLEGFVHVEFNNIKSLKANLNKNVSAVMLEPIQGEGGINVADNEYLRQIRRICDEEDILLIFDEVQTGMGRTGKLFCYQNYNVVPDIVVLAKSLASGFPIGAVIAGKKCSDIFTPGTHASTFGGSPLACSAALETLKIIEEEKLLENVEIMSKLFMEKFESFKEKFPFIKRLKGKGLMMGIELDIEAKPVAESCFKNGLLINATQNNILRVLPAINIDKKTAVKGLEIMEETFKEIL